MRIAILGRTQMLYNTIRMLQDTDNEIVLIATCKARSEYKVDEKGFEEKARELNVPYFCDAHLDKPEIIQKLQALNADIAISVNWLTIISEKVTQCFKYGILNGHCGDLPKYRGNACPNWAIIKGEKTYSVSVHYMEPGELDSGDIVLKKTFPITEQTSITEIYNNLEQVLPEMFIEAVNKVKKYGRVGSTQSKDLADSLRCYPRIPTDSFIDWNFSCDEISKIVRASCSPFTGAYTYYGNKKLHIMSVEVRPFDFPCYVYPGQVINILQDSVDVAAADGIVRIKEVIVDGIVYSAREILNSIRIRLNYGVEEEIYLLRREMEELQNELGKIRKEMK